MITQPDDLPYVIFTFLSLSRQKIPRSRWTVQAFKLYGLVLARPSFWQRLSIAAGLLSDDHQPTLAVSYWLSLSLEQQWRTILSAWVRMEGTAGGQKRRTRLLRTRFRIPVSPRDASGLAYLGVYNQGALTSVGEQIVIHHLSGPHLVELWEIQNNLLRISFPTRWDLLWELEANLKPYLPGQYALTPATLRQSPVGNPDRLVKILEEGTGQELVPWIRAFIHNRPSIKLHQGVVLEFSQPDELTSLREQPVLRRLFIQVLSPHYVRLEPLEVPKVCKTLDRLGFAVETSTQFRQINQVNVGTNRSPQTILSTNDCGYLFALAIIAEKMGFSVAAPEGILDRIQDGLSDLLKSAAVSTAESVVDQYAPSWYHSDADPDFPPLPEPDLLALIEKAIQLGETVEMSYQAAGSSTPEIRRVTPLLVERRGSRSYLLAYCHTRRANRTFRIDRIQFFDQCR